MLKILIKLQPRKTQHQKAFYHLSNKSLQSFSKWYRRLWIPRSVQPPYSHVTQIGDPILRQKAELVPKEYIKSKEINLVVKRMLEVLRKYDCVGLAAPQIGVSLRIIVMEFSVKLKEEFSSSLYEARQMEPLPLTILINPTLKVINFSKKSFPESCASVKGYSGDVERYEEVSLCGVTQADEEVSLNLKGWNARIAQHEMDHLDGKIYTDIMDRSTFACSCWETVNTRAGRIEIPFYPK